MGGGRKPYDQQASLWITKSGYRLAPIVFVPELTSLHTSHFPTICPQSGTTLTFDDPGVESGQTHGESTSCRSPGFNPPSSYSPIRIRISRTTDKPRAPNMRLTKRFLPSVTVTR